MRFENLACAVLRPLVISAAIAAPAPVLAQGVDAALAMRAGDIAAVLKGERAAAEVFSAAFLASVPAAQIAEITRQLESQGGKLVGVDEVKQVAPGAATFRLRFERADAAAVVQLDAAAPYRVAGFRVTGMAPSGDGPQAIAADFAALPGKAGFAVMKLGTAAPQTVQALNPDQQFAIGSAFKLWVLDAVAEDVAAGRLKWDQVVRLGQRSLPSGMTQGWPQDAPVTVATLATLMISISDNTATDTLIRLVGRNRIAERVRANGHSAPDRILPFMTTAEAFALKLGPKAAQDAYGKAGDAEQARRLGTLDLPAALANPATSLDKPVAIDSAEWFASPADIARVMDSLRMRPDPQVLAILGVSPSLGGAQRAMFRYAGFKGGSESGVINLSWLLERPTGEWVVVTASWNDPAAPVDEKRFERLAQRLIGQAAR